MTSYVTQFARGSNGARVGAGPRSSHALESLAELPQDGGDPRLVVLDATAAHALVERDRVLDLVDRGGAVRRAAIADEGAVRSLPFVTGEGVILAPIDLRWDGTSKTIDAQQILYARAVDAEGAQVVVSLQGSRWIAVGQERASRQGPEVLRVSSASLTDAKAFWRAEFPGSGTAAIADDGRVMVATPEGHLVVFARDGNPATNEGVRLVDVDLGEVPRFVSAIAPGTVTLAARDGRATRVRGFDARGTAVWSGDVGFEARQPAIEGGDGRTYVVGQGVAALRGGAVLWAAPSEASMSATAFADGTLAICVGSALRLVDPEGHIRVEMRTPGDEPILTPPAIGPDGAVWLATRRALYVAR